MIARYYTVVYVSTMEMNVDHNPQNEDIATVREHFGKYIEVLTKRHINTTVSNKNVFRPADQPARKVLDKILANVLLPGSSVVGVDYLYELFEYGQQKKSCLILMEHYSNFDFPALIHLLAKQGKKARQISEAIIPMAALKLNEENDALSALSDAYAHISIFPARRVDQLSMAEHHDPELKKAREINHAALKKMRELKNSGHPILMFPSGTRYKPDNPQTKRVVKAADSFLKYFDYVIFGGIAGNTLMVNNPDDMLSDILRRDVMIYAFSKPVRCKNFRKTVHTTYKDSIDNGEDAGMLVVSQIEKELEVVHQLALERYAQYV